MELKTENQARGMVCPMRASSGGDRDCVGSGCMWWEFADGPPMGWRARPAGWPGERPDDSRPVGVPASWEYVDDEQSEDGPGWREPESEWQARRRGGCAEVRGRPWE
jgi:hypothetical protein